MEDNYPVPSSVGMDMPHIHFSESMLPEVKDFKPGETYIIEIELKVREIHTEGGMENKDKLGAEGRICSAKLIKKRKKQYNIPIGS